MPFRLAAIVALVLTLLSPGATDAAKPLPRFDVSLEAAARSVTLGERVVFKGVVKPGVTGDDVILQSRTSKGSPWTRVRSVELQKGGRYRVTSAPKSAAVHFYRVLKPADRRHRVGVSSVVRVRVFAWHYLSDLKDPVVWMMYVGEPIKMNGRTYPESIYDYDGESSSFQQDVDRKCRTLDVTFGLTDESTSDGTAVLELLGDGNRLYARDFTFGAVERKQIDISGVLRLRFTTTNPSLQSVGHGAMGSPRILCAF